MVICLCGWRDGRGNGRRDEWEGVLVIGERRGLWDGRGDGERYSRGLSRLWGSGRVW